MRAANTSRKATRRLNEAEYLTELRHAALPGGPRSDQGGGKHKRAGTREQQRAPLEEGPAAQRGRPCELEPPGPAFDGACEERPPEHERDCHADPSRYGRSTLAVGEAERRDEPDPAQMPLGVSPLLVPEMTDALRLAVHRLVPDRVGGEV